MLRPLTEADDLSDWEVVGQSDERRGPARSEVVLKLDPEQAAWVRHQAAQAGLTQAAYLKRLIDEARGVGGPAAGR